MTEAERIELFAALAELSRRYPHWRVGQLVANVAGWADADVWDADDRQLLMAAREHLESSRRSAQSGSSGDQVRSPTTAATLSDR